MLLQPVLVFSRKEYLPARLPVLLDTSQSMSLQDAYVDSNRARSVVEALKLEGGLDALREASRVDLARAAMTSNWLDRLTGGDERKVELFRFDEKAETLGGFTNLTAEGASTRLGSVVRNLLLRYKGVPLAGVVIATDGQSNAGDPMEQAVAMAGVEDVPIYALMLGTPEGPRNAKIKALESSPAVFVRDPIEITAVIESQGLDQKEIEVVLEGRRNGGVWQELSRESVLLEKTQPVQRVLFQHEERAPMRLDLRATLEGVPSELTEDDNVATARIRVVRQKIRVLFIAGNTFPEVQFLRNALLRDDGILMSSWLMTATKDYEHPGDRPIKRLPVTQEEFDDFDVVILYDPDPDEWLPNFPEMLERFVARA
ncbi:MAG: vWA domain-containing protein, partial [Verrucomicrobiota bacterium]